MSIRRPDNTEIRIWRRLATRRRWSKSKYCKQNDDVDLNIYLLSNLFSGHGVNQPCLKQHREEEDNPGFRPKEAEEEDWFRNRREKRSENAKHNFYISFSGIKFEQKLKIRNSQRVFQAFCYCCQGNTRFLNDRFRFASYKRALCFNLQNLSSKENRKKDPLL